MPIPSITVDANPSERPSDSVPQTEPQRVETEEDLPTEAPLSDSTAEDLTEPVQSEPTEQREPTESQPDASAEAPLPTEPGVIDEYIATGEGTPAG